MAEQAIDSKELARLRALDQKDKERKAKERRYWAEQSIILRKAREKGITATDAEIAEYLKTMRSRS